MSTSCLLDSDKMGRSVLRSGQEMVGIYMCCIHFYFFIFKAAAISIQGRDPYNLQGEGPLSTLNNFFFFACTAQSGQLEAGMLALAWLC